MPLIENADLNGKTVGLVVALNKLGFRRSDQTLPEFSAELKALTDEDREWFAERFAIEYGCTIKAAGRKAA